MNNFSGIVGHDKQIAALCSAAKKGEIPHAYLFSGPDGVGKKATALAFARALFCVNWPDGGEDSCGQCVNCRRVDGGNFPDLHYIEPTVHDKKIKKEIDVKDIRELIGKLSYKAYEGGYKIAIVDDLTKMNITAANAFLKTLEEPPPDTIIILVTSNVVKLPPTIASRCQEIRFSKLSNERMITFIKERLSAPDEEAVMIAALSKGLPGVAIAGSLEQDRQIRDGAWSIIKSATDPGMAGEMFRLASYLDKQKEKSGTDQTIEAVIDLLRDLMSVKIKGKCDRLVNVDIKSEIVQTARQYSRRRLLRGYQAACKMSQARLLNISPLLVISLLALELRK